jgi:hypothetical protein
MPGGERANVTAGLGACAQPAHIMLVMDAAKKEEWARRIGGADSFCFDEMELRAYLLFFA